jgi:hypothetical protein
MFCATYSILDTISKEGINDSQHGDAKAAYMVLTSFDFAFDESDYGIY